MKHLPTYYKYTCVVYNVYALLQYLLYASDEQLKMTYFFLVHPGSFDERMAKRIGNARLLYHKPEESMWKQRLKVLFHFRWWIKHTDIYAQDCHLMASWLIGNSEYTYLEDCPATISMLRPEIDFIKVPERLRLGIPGTWKYGSVFGHPGGTNNQCENRLLTQDVDIQSIYVKDRRFEKVDMLALWNKASDWKKSYILKVYDIDDTALTKLENYKVWFLSSPLHEDAQMTVKEIVNLYTIYFEDYLNDGLIIKPHPRDKFNYEKYFPRAMVFRSKAPMQLLVEMLQLKVEKAVTVCSSAISAFDQSKTEIIRLGTHIHPKILAKWGE